MFFVGLLFLAFGDLKRDLTQDYFGNLKRLLVCDIFLRLVCVSYLLAFGSMYVQIKGLCSQSGLFPIRTTLDQLRQWKKNTKWNLAMPGHCISLLLVDMTQIMLSSSTNSDTHLNYYMMSSCVASTLGILFPHPIVFLYLYLSYYSLKRITSQVTNLQWDSLLLEVGVTCVLLSMAVSLQNSKLIVICNWLVKLLLFRLMFGSGFVKWHSRLVSFTPETFTTVHTPVLLPTNFYYTVSTLLSHVCSSSTTPLLYLPSPFTPSSSPTHPPPPSPLPPHSLTPSYPPYALPLPSLSLITHSPPFVS